MNSSTSILVKAIVSDSNLFNGHSQVLLNCMLSFEDLQPLMFELEEYYPDKIRATFWPDGSGHIEAIGFWKEGEHKMGHLDKVLFSWGED